MNPIMFPFYVHFEQQIKREKKPKPTNLPSFTFYRLDASSLYCDYLGIEILH